MTRKISFFNVIVFDEQVDPGNQVKETTFPENGKPAAINPAGQLKSPYRSYIDFSRLVANKGSVNLDAGRIES